MSIDPRLMERRKVVAEDNAKRRVARLLRLLVWLLVPAGLVWVLFSPWLSVDRVETAGIVSSSTNSILVHRGLVAGAPMFLVGPDAVERALLKDPWILEASVERDWPDLVTVEVVERVPAAWTLTEGGWTRRAVDGTALPSADVPDGTMGRVEFPDMPDEAAVRAPEMLGALEFVAAVSPAWQEDLVVSELEGELWATVQGYQARLGRPVDMAEKALSLNALLARDLPAGSTLVLIAPTHPAVTAPIDEGSEKSDPQSPDGSVESEDEP